ncbi:hypothetical protein FUA26_01405 [Seonamhaeicola algicola]|uniref:Hydroxyacid dehydrogenase n=1 Tax=Seonamhaeicola algicola TaxID=1719036 RepID=A0A5C7B5K2_9FLAO|nr:four-carbon acid sugar kinase family protein [Seonamhaeicola algicola]TXE15193.1 hypothetical protein FUA26_01405 [Seonamhaeicola algicola]
MNNVLSNILATLPKPENTNYRSLNQQLFNKLNKACIVIDDDPTGNQTVYNIPLLTNWNETVFIEEFTKGTPVFFVLTNSRSLSAKETKKVYTEIAQNILKASKISKREFVIISRSDSTLRGHFPLEPSTLKINLKLQDAITVFLPVMFEGNRVTVNDTHYILDDDILTPVNNTPFAQDHSFKYSKANLKAYIEEKSEGSIKASSVISFSLEAIRTKSTKELADAITSLPKSCYCIFNSINYSDLDKVTQALLLAQQNGKQIIYRTSSSFVPSYIGQKPKDILTAEDVIVTKTNTGGLTIVGSYVKKSSDQLKEALQLFNATTTFEVDVEKVLSENSNEYIQAFVNKLNIVLKSGEDCIVFTSRKLITGTDASTTINIAAVISNALVKIVEGLTTQPKYLIAKGGITSHDLATKGLKMRRSKVIGQIQAGIPVWKMNNQTKFPNLPYIVFPGNVGSNKTLKDVITKLN